MNDKVPAAGEQSIIEVQISSGTPVNDVLLQEISVIACYEDPGFQQALKELLYRPENKELLLIYE